MTKFITYYNLCTIHDTKDFLGLSPDCDNANIIVTLGRNIAIVIKISTQNQIRSWSMLEKFSCRVVYDRRSQQYVGVFGHRNVRLWDETVTEINKCKKLKFHKKIVDLVYDPQEVLLIYADGTCESLSSALLSRKEHESDSNDIEMMTNVQFIDPKIVNLNNGRKFLTYFQKYEDKPIELIKIELDQATLKPIGATKRMKLTRNGLGVCVSGYSVIETETLPALLTIWSDGRVFLWNLVDNLDDQNSPGQFVSIFNDLKVDTPLTILGISKHCVAIYGANSTQEGGSVLLYNTQFKVIKAKQFFKIYFDYSRLWLVGSNILLAMGQNISVVTYQMSKETLSELVGSQLSNDFSQKVRAEFVNEEEELEENMCLANEQTPDYFDKHKQKKTQLIFADGKTVPFLDDEHFNKELNRLMNREVHVDLVQIDSAQTDIDINLMSNYNDPGFVTEEVQIIAKHLEGSGASEHEITEKLLWFLIRADLVQDIAVCLRRYTHVSERILTKTLKYVLSGFKVPQNEEQNLVKPTMNGDHMEVDILSEVLDDKDFPNIDLLAQSNGNPTQPIKERKDLMNIVLSCSFDTKSISSHIRREINYEEVLTMLEYLYILINKESICLEERPDCPDILNEEIRILRWLEVFLNTHFQKLTLSKDERLFEILSKWDDVFNDYKKQISDLQNAASVLYNIINKKQFSKQKNYSKWYSIEEVQLY